MDVSISDVVNDAVRATLKEDATELDVFEKRRREPNVDFERLVERIASLADDPRPAGAEKLSGTRDKYRIRQGNFRILYEIQDDVLTVSTTTSA